MKIAKAAQFLLLRPKNTKHKKHPTLFFFFLNKISTTFFSLFVTKQERKVFFTSNFFLSPLLSLHKVSAVKARGQINPARSRGDVSFLHPHVFRCLAADTAVSAAAAGGREGEIYFFSIVRPHHQFFPQRPPWHEGTQQLSE